MTVNTQAQLQAPEFVAFGDPDAAATAASRLRAGWVAAIPTDTVYGLAAAIDQPRAIARLYALKGRPESKAIPVLLADAADLARVAAPLAPAAKALAEALWPGALTLVVPALAGVPEPLTSTAEDGTRTIAVRVPEHALAREIIAAVGGALAVTSANRSGDEPATDAQQVLRLGEAAPDIVVDGGRAARAIPSTIVLALPSATKILREGAIPASSIADVISRVAARPRRGGPNQQPTV